jgi:hypothetical protein
MNKGDILEEFSDEEYRRFMRPDISEEDFYYTHGRELSRNLQNADRRYTDRTFSDENE